MNIWQNNAIVIFEQFTYQVLLEVDERESATVGRHPHKLGSYFFKPSVFFKGAKMLDIYK